MTAGGWILGDFFQGSHEVDSCNCAGEDVAAKSGTPRPSEYSGL